MTPTVLGGRCGFRWDGGVATDLDPAWNMAGETRGNQGTGHVPHMGLAENYGNDPQISDHV